jgi:hypothetical protein
METLTTAHGFVFDYYFSNVTEDAFGTYAKFIYLVVKRLDDPQSDLVKRRAYLVPFALLHEFFTEANLPREKIVHVEPLTMEMVSFTRDELRKDHVNRRSI